MPRQRIRIKDFAESLGLSTATVSRAFSSKGRISEKTRSLVRMKAEELGYRANVHARNLILGRCEGIAFFYPQLIDGEPDYFISEIMLGVSDACSKINIPLQIHPLSDGHMDFYKDIVLGGSITGVIVISGPESSTALIRLAEESGIQCVVVGPLPAEGKSHITYDNGKGGFLAGRYFWETGRKHPAYVCGISDRSKREGFKKGLGGIARNLFIDEGGSTFHDGSLAFERIIKSAAKTDCVLCANDIIAIGFIRAALMKGIRIPQEMAVIGFDDIRIASFHTPALSTIRLHTREIGENAVKQLKKLMDGDGATRIKLDCELVIRESA